MKYTTHTTYFNCILQLHTSTSYYNYILHLHTTTSYFNYILQLHTTTTYFDYILQYPKWADTWIKLICLCIGYMVVLDMNIEYDTKNLFSMMKNMNEYIMTHCSALYESMLSTWFIENVYQVKYYYYVLAHYLHNV